MAQRLHNLNKWRFMAEGMSWHYGSTKRRIVRIDVNCPDAVQFYIVQDREAVEANPERLQDLDAGRRVDGLGEDRFPFEPTESDLFEAGKGAVVSFVGRCVGRDTLEFGVDGAFDLVPVGGSAYVSTADSSDISTKVLAPVIFTRIANRRQRNPHLELIEYQMRLNQRRFEEQLHAESERRMAALEARLGETYARKRDQRAPLEELERRRTAGASGDVEGADPGEDERREPAKPPKDEGGGGSDVPAKRRKVAAPPLAD